MPRRIFSAVDGYHRYHGKVYQLLVYFSLNLIGNWRALDNLTVRCQIGKVIEHNLNKLLA